MKLSITRQFKLSMLMFIASFFTAGLLVKTGSVSAHGNAHSNDQHSDSATPDIAIDVAGDSAVGVTTAGFDYSVGKPIPADIVRVTPEPQMNPAVGGRWSDVYDWPLVAIHAALLPNGKVLAWDATPDDADDDPHTTDNYTTRVTLWDPASNTHVPTNNDTDTDLFCAGSAHLWDGRILFAGGDGGRAGANGPLANTNIYNPVSNTWHRTENMNAPRWYSSVAALSNGEMLTLGGTYDPLPLAEVFQFDQTWRPLAGSFPIELTGDYQWLQQTPEGSVISFGPSDLILDIDTNESGSYTPIAGRDGVQDRDYGSYAMYDVGKILVSGGEEGLSSAVIIDTATKQTVDTSPMNNGRRQHNLTILADGSVLATGGNSDGARFYSPTAPVFVPEIWNPDTGVWREVNTIPTDRQYHAIAILLPDGQVLSAGGGICGDCYRLNYEERNAEIFSPPYLFNQDGTLAARPNLGSVPTVADYAESFNISVNHTLNIAKAHLIKLGSVTHSENQDQRLVPLAFTQQALRLSLTMPDSRHVAPPGHYLLYVVDTNGVPSVGTMLKLGQPQINANEVVNSTLEVNAWDTYLTHASTGQSVVQLNASNGTSLYVSAQAPVRSAQQSGILCQAQVVGSAGARCEVSVPADTTLHISVNGSLRGDYSLSYQNTGNTTVTEQNPVSQEPQEPSTSGTGSTTPPEASPTGDNAEGIPTASSGVSVGGGAVSQLWLLILVFFAVSRSNSGHIRRV